MLRRSVPGCIRQALGLAFALACLAGCDSDESDGSYPSRAIRLIVPFAPGGSTDTFARIYKKAIDDNALLPAPLAIVNVDGAAGTIGSRRVKNASPDGYTILLLHHGILTAKHSGKVRYGPEAFEPIAGTGESQLVIAARADAPFRDLRHVLERAAAEPDTITFGANLGAPSHFVGRQLETALSGARFRFVQTGGGAKRFASLRGGHIELTIFSIEEFLRFRSTGLRVLALLDSARHERLPEIPTAIEQGVDLVSGNMHSWWAPRETPQERLGAFAEVLRRAGATEYVKSKMDELCCDPVFLSGLQLRDRMSNLEAQFTELTSTDPVPLPSFPGIAASITLLLLALVVVDAWRERGDGIERPRGRPTSEAAVFRAIGCGVLTISYVAAISSGWVSFPVATAVFIFACGAVLTHMRRALVSLAAVGLAAGFGLHWVFTVLFAVDLP